MNLTVYYYRLPLCPDFYGLYFHWGKVLFVITFRSLKEKFEKNNLGLWLSSLNIYFFHYCNFALNALHLRPFRFRLIRTFQVAFSYVAYLFQLHNVAEKAKHLTCSYKHLSLELKEVF